MIRSAGHSVFEVREYTQIFPIRDACLQWLDSLKDEVRHNDNTYPLARKAAENIEASLPEIEALYLEPKIQSHPNAWTLGFFMSALYNKCKEQVIVNDAQNTPYGLATCLPADKIFINNTTCAYAGGNAAGILVNRGKTHSFGRDSSGVVINVSKEGSDFSAGYHGKLVLNAGQWLITSNDARKFKYLRNGRPWEHSEKPLHLIVHEICKNDNDRWCEFDDVSAYSWYFERLAWFAKHAPEKILDEFGTAQDIISTYKKLQEAGK